jgi:hypothetical protein
MRAVTGIVTDLDRAKSARAFATIAGMLAYLPSSVRASTDTVAGILSDVG